MVTIDLEVWSHYCKIVSLHLAASDLKAKEISQHCHHCPIYNIFWSLEMICNSYKSNNQFIHIL